MPLFYRHYCEHVVCVNYSIAVFVLHTIRLSWAQLTRKPPALSRHLAAAALGLGRVEGLGHRAFASFKFSETEALSGICREKQMRKSL